MKLSQCGEHVWREAASSTHRHTYIRTYKNCALVICHETATVWRACVEGNYLIHTCTHVRTRNVLLSSAIQLCWSAEPINIVLLYLVCDKVDINASHTAAQFTLQSVEQNDESVQGMCARIVTNTQDLVLVQFSPLSCISLGTASH